MKKIVFIFLFCYLEIQMIHAYEVSGKFLGLHGISKNKAYLEIESSFDFGGCLLNIDVHRINKIHFHKSCNFLKDKRYGNLVCSEDHTHCIKKDSIGKEILKRLNEYTIWYVSGVSSDDTLSMRNGAGSKYKKIHELAPYVSYLKVLSMKMNGATTWYKVKYKNIIGWVSSRYLNCRER